MKIGLYGGTFDPIHTAHLVIAQFIKEDLSLDKIVFIPSGIPPHKDVFLSPELRLEMVQRCIQGNPHFECSRFEIDRTVPSFSVDTIEHFSKQVKFVEGELLWIMGSDNFIDFQRWKDPGRILELCTVVVFPRTSADYDRCPPGYLDRVLYLKHAPMVEISSTQVRSRIQQGLSIRYFVPDSVEEMIRSQKSYTLVR